MTQKLKTYNSEADVPTELKGFYAANASGKWEPQFDGVDSISGLVSKRDELLGKVSGHASEMQTKQTEIDRLTGELSNARNSSLPRGHKAVPNADAELLEALKAEGVTTPDAFKTLKTEHGTYKTEAESSKAAKHAASVGEAMGWDKEKTARLATKVYDFSQLEVREEGGKKAVVAKVKQADNTFVEKPFGEVVKATPELSDLLPSLGVTTGGTRVPGSTVGGGTPAANEFDQIRNEVKETQKAVQPKDNASVLAALNGQRPAATA